MELKKSLASKRNEFNNKKGVVDSNLAEQGLELNKTRRRELNETLYSIENELTQVKKQTSLLTTQLESLTMQERELKNKINLVKASPIKSTPSLNPQVFREEKKQAMVISQQQHVVSPNSSPQIVPERQVPYQQNKPTVEQPKVPVAEVQPVISSIQQPQYNIQELQESVPPVFAPQKSQVLQQPQLNPKVNQAPVNQAQPPAAPVEAPPKKPEGPESQSEIRYKNCLSSISGTWHEDDTILITISRSVNVPMKSAAFKVTFENKLTDTTLHIKGLELLGYDNKGKLVK